MSRILYNGALLVMLATVAYVFRDPLFGVYHQLYAEVRPCRAPILYSIRALDDRFDMTEDDVRGALREAEAVWEKVVDRDLFAYDPQGDLEVNFVYDLRQATTERLQELDGVVDASLATYEDMRVAFEAARSEYLRERAAFSARADAFDDAQRAYTRDVRSWNSKGGAPPEEYRRMQEQKAVLERELSALKKIEDDLNAAADEVNAMVRDLNATAHRLNLNVAAYNSVGKAVPDEFEEGLYTESLGSRTIEIYEFSSREKLVRVLAHELGHALGLEHVEDRNAIMYPVNRAVSPVATDGDIEELERRCGIE